MKNFLYFPALCLALGVFSPVERASADVLAFDNFEYADGSLVPNGGWANHSGTAGDLQVVSEAAVLVMDGSLSEDANLAFTPGSGDKVYYGIDFSVAAAADFSGTDSEYFAHFKTDGFDYSARFDVVEGQSGGNFTVGIASDESIADTIWGSDLVFDTVYRAVVEYDQVENIAKLWIDAANESDTSITGEDRANPGDTVTQFALRQANSDGDETITVDNLVVGTTFADVVNPVPEPGSLGVLAMFGLAGLLRRKK